MLKAHYVLRGSRKLRFSAHVIQSEKLIGALIDGLAALRWLQGGRLARYGVDMNGAFLRCPKLRKRVLA
jgi:hypothetical protein